MCRSSTSERTVKGKLKNMSFLDANSSTLTKNIVIITYPEIMIWKNGQEEEETTVVNNKKPQHGITENMIHKGLSQLERGTYPRYK